MSGRWYKSLGEAGRAWNLSVVEIFERAIAGKLGLAGTAMTWSGNFADVAAVELDLNRLKDGLEPKFQLCVPVPEFERYSAKLVATKPARPKIPRKTKTIQTREAWQLRINKLGTDSDHAEKSHTKLCRLLAKETGVNFQTIRRHTRKLR